METVDQIRKHYRFTSADEDNLKELAEVLGPFSGQLADDFYEYLLEDSYTASFFPDEEAIRRRKATMKSWFQNLFTSRYDRRYLMRMQRVGQVHVKIGLRGHYVNSGMTFVRSFCLRRLIRAISDPAKAEDLLETLDKVLDINLDVMTSSYREAELKKVFLSHRVESWLVRWSERLLHGLNLILMVGLLAMALGVATLLASDVIFAFTANLENGIIKALGSLLILWMMIELLHTQVEHLRGGKLHVRVFVELALVAFIRKLFVASIDQKDPITVGLLLAGLLILGLIFLFLAKAEGPGK